jgi:hypothetical protein
VLWGCAALANEHPRGHLVGVCRTEPPFRAFFAFAFAGSVCARGAARVPASWPRLIVSFSHANPPPKRAQQAMLL